MAARTEGSNPELDRLLELLIKCSSEQRKRDLNALRRYNSGKIKHDKQMQFHQCMAENRWVFGGNRCGKTECGAAETAWIALSRHPFRQNLKESFGWVVSLSMQVQRDVAQDKILKYLPKESIADIVMHSGSRGAPEYGVIDFILVKNDMGGLSKIGFKSCDQGREKFQGASLDYVWFDEEPPEDIYSECRMRLLDKNGIIYGTMTPLKGQTFVYTDIYLKETEDPSIKCFFMEWADNPFLDKKAVDKMTISMPKDELEVRRYGRFKGLAGLVYPNFSTQTHVIEPFKVPPEWYDNISIDPGLNNPLSCHFYACDGDGNVYVVAEHYEAQQDITYHAKRIKEIAKELNWHTDGQGRLESLIDSAANSRTLASSKSVAELFYDHGILVNTNVNKDVFTGISRVKAYLRNAEGNAKLFIFAQCAHMISEIKKYRWGSADVPVKTDDHAMDELRYYIMSKPEPYKEPIKKSMITKDIEKRIRKLKNSRMI